MKLFDYIFATIYFFYEAINDGRPGNVGKSAIGAIIVLTLLMTFNFLSFFKTNVLKEYKWLYYFVVTVVCGILIIGFYRKKRYLRIVTQFNEIKNKETYYLITIAYVILSLVVFVKTR